MQVQSQLYWPTVYFMKLVHFLTRQHTIIEGESNLPKSGGCVFAPKHHSNGDPPKLIQSLKRHIFFMGKIGLFRRTITRFYYLHASVFPVNDKSRRSIIAALDFATSLAKEGKVVGIFPEGTKTPGTQLGKIHGGAIKVSREANVPLVPIGLAYSDNYHATFWKPRQRIAIVIGKPILPEELEDTDHPTLLLEARLNQLMKRADQLLSR